MVVTHLPSNVLLIMVPLMPNETAAITMLCLRYSISQMDVPTRNAYVQVCFSYFFILLFVFYDLLCACM